MSGSPFIDWAWVGRNLDDIWQRIVEHLLLTGIAIGVGLAVSLILSAIALRNRRTYAPILGVTGVLYTIPSLGLFAFLVPFTGLTMLTAEIALVSYTLLILVRNIVAGIDGVPEDVREAARGMGYDERQLRWRIEVPIALPVIIAGLRIATVTIVGLVTVTAIIGQGGLGALILDGFNRSIAFATPIALGTGLSIALAAVLDLLLIGIERVVTPWAAGGRR